MSSSKPSPTAYLTRSHRVGIVLLARQTENRNVLGLFTRIRIKIADKQIGLDSARSGILAALVAGDDKIRPSDPVKRRKRAAGNDCASRT